MLFCFSSKNILISECFDCVPWKNECHIIKLWQIFHFGMKYYLKLWHNSTLPEQPHIPLTNTHYCIVSICEFTSHVSDIRVHDKASYFRLSTVFPVFRSSEPVLALQGQETFRWPHCPLRMRLSSIVKLFCCHISRGGTTLLLVQKFREQNVFWS